jgi:hypothetical protein
MPFTLSYRQGRYSVPLAYVSRKMTQAADSTKGRKDKDPQTQTEPGDPARSQRAAGRLWTFRSLAIGGSPSQSRDPETYRHSRYTDERSVLPNRVAVRIQREHWHGPVRSRCTSSRRGGSTTRSVVPDARGICSDLPDPALESEGRKRSDNTHVTVHLSAVSLPSR